MDPRIETIWKSINKDRLQQILLESLDIYSPTGCEEQIQDYYYDLLTDAGYQVERQIVEERRPNIYLQSCPGNPQILFTGHVDTVADWETDTLSDTSISGVIYGLGAADMKSGCAAMVELFLVMAEVLPEEERPCVALLLVVGEEEDGDGTAAYLKQEVIPPVVIIGEPTALAVCFRHYGYLEIGLETGGRRIHSSLPEMGSNAVESMLKFLLLLSSEPLFVKEDTGVVYSIREMSSSRRGFVVPDRCEAWIDVHIPPDKEYDSVITRVRELEEIAKNETENLDLTLNFQVNAAGYELPVKGPVPRMLSESYEELGLPLLFETFRSHSDGNLFFQKDVQPIILGPGSLETAHTSDEHVRFDQVITATRIYAALALTKFPENK